MIVFFVFREKKKKKHETMIDNIKHVYPHLDSNNMDSSQTFMRLSSLFEERGNAYANANARVCLESK